MPNSETGPLTMENYSETGPLTMGNFRKQMQNCEKQAEKRNVGGSGTGNGQENKKYATDTNQYSDEEEATSPSLVGDMLTKLGKEANKFNVTDVFYDQVGGARKCPEGIVYAGSRNSTTDLLFSSTTPGKAALIESINQVIGEIAVGKYVKKNEKHCNKLLWHSYYEWDPRENYPGRNFHSELKHGSRAEDLGTHSFKAYEYVTKEIPVLIRTREDLIKFNDFIKNSSTRMDSVTRISQELESTIKSLPAQQKDAVNVDLIASETDKTSIANCLNTVIGQLARDKYQQLKREPDKRHCETLLKHIYYDREQFGCCIMKSDASLKRSAPTVLKSTSSKAFQAINNHLPVSISTIQDFEEIYQLIENDVETSCTVATGTLHEKIISLCLESFQKNLVKYEQNKDLSFFSRSQKIADFLLSKAFHCNEITKDKVALLHGLTAFYSPETDVRYRRAINDTDTLKQYAKKSQDEGNIPDDINRILSKDSETQRLWVMCYHAEKILTDINNKYKDSYILIYGPCPFDVIFQQFITNILSPYKELKLAFEAAAAQINAANKGNISNKIQQDIITTDNELIRLNHACTTALEDFKSKEYKKSLFKSQLKIIISSETDLANTLCSAPKQWGADFENLIEHLIDDNVSEKDILDKCQRRLFKISRTKGTKWFSTDDATIKVEVKARYETIKTHLRNTFIPKKLLPAFYGNRTQFGIRDNFNLTLLRLDRLVETAKLGQLTLSEIATFTKEHSDKPIPAEKINTLGEQLYDIILKTDESKDQNNKLTTATHGNKAACTQQLKKALSLDNEPTIDNAFNAIEDRLIAYKTSKAVMNNSTYFDYSNHRRALNIESEYTCFKFIQELNTIAKSQGYKDGSWHINILLPFITNITNNTGVQASPQDIIKEFKKVFNLPTPLLQSFDVFLQETDTAISLQRAFKNGSFAHAMKNYFLFDTDSLERESSYEEQHQLDIMTFALSGCQTRTHQGRQGSNQTIPGRIRNGLFNKTFQSKGNYNEKSLTTALVSSSTTNASSRFNWYPRNITSVQKTPLKLEKR